MLKRFLSLIFIALLITGCARLARAPVSAIKPFPVVESSEQIRQMPAFNRVNVEGKLNVSLHTGYQHPSIILRGDPRDLSRISTRISDDNLFIAIGKRYPNYGPVSVEIRSHYLNAFNYKGAGVITGTNIHSGLLDLSIDNPGQTTLGGSLFLRKLVASGGGNIQLNDVNSQYLHLTIKDSTTVRIIGAINLSKLNLEGKGSLSMYWVKSDNLSICGKGTANIQLAGIVNTLELDLWDSARFYGRYLRARRAFVKTHDHAVADINALKHQHTLAMDASDIYFYNIPQTKADFMAYAGSVLDMREWHPYDLKEYNRYNK